MLILHQREVEREARDSWRMSVSSSQRLIWRVSRYASNRRAKAFCQARFGQQQRLLVTAAHAERVVQTSPENKFDLHSLISLRVARTSSRQEPSFLPPSTSARAGARTSGRLASAGHRILLLVVNHRRVGFTTLPRNRGTLQVSS